MINELQAAKSEREKRVLAMGMEEELRQKGYGRKRVRVMCPCGWRGRRIWGPKMFKKPCPRCGTIHVEGRTSVYCPNRVIKN